MATRRTRAESGTGLSMTSVPTAAIANSACLAIRRTRAGSTSRVESSTRPVPAETESSTGFTTSCGRPKTTSSRSLSTDAGDIPVRPPPAGYRLQAHDGTGEGHERRVPIPIARQIEQRLDGAPEADGIGVP